MKKHAPAIMQARRQLFEQVAQLASYEARLSYYSVETCTYPNCERLQLQWEGFNLGLDARNLAC